MKKRVKPGQRIPRELQILKLDYLFSVCKKHNWNPRYNWESKNFIEIEKLKHYFTDVFPTQTHIIEAWETLNVSQKLKEIEKDTAEWASLKESFIDEYYAAQREYGRYKYKMRKGIPSILEDCGELESSVTVYEASTEVDDRNIDEQLSNFEQLNKVSEELKEIEEFPDDYTEEEYEEKKRELCFILSNISKDDLELYHLRGISHIDRNNCTKCHCKLPTQFMLNLKHINSFYIVLIVEVLFQIWNHKKILI